MSETISDVNSVTGPTKETPACFALCPLALPHDVTACDVIWTEKREERPKTAKSQERPRPNKGIRKVQQDSAGQWFLNNTQQQQHKVCTDSGTTARQLASSQALRYMRTRTTRINVSEIYEEQNWCPAEQ